MSSRDWQEAGSICNAQTLTTSMAFWPLVRMRTLQGAKHSASCSRGLRIPVKAHKPNRVKCRPPLLNTYDSASRTARRAPERGKDKQLDFFDSTAFPSLPPLLLSTSSAASWQPAISRLISKLSLHKRCGKGNNSRFDSPEARLSWLIKLSASKFHNPLGPAQPLISLARTTRVRSTTVQ